MSQDKGERAPLEGSRIFEGRELLLIGGTGFLGKVFWSMLLSAYPSIGRIHLVVRPSGGLDPEARFWRSIATSEALSPLRKTHGEGFESFLREKIAPVDGDVGRPLAGIAGELVAKLEGRIAAVVNVAGLVDFNPPLDEALAANASSSKNLVELCRALRAPLFHTSTCYVSAGRKGPVLEEDPTVFPFPRADELSPSRWDAEREIEECLAAVAEERRRAGDAFQRSRLEAQAAENLEKRGEPASGDVFSGEVAKLERARVRERLVATGLERARHWGWPNIYTYTKSIGEQLIARSGVPYAIARPACCESTVAFPFPGYNEGISTSAPQMYLMLKAPVTVPASEAPLDFIPTDYVCAGMIAALAELVEGSSRGVYQMGASDLNPCSARRLGELAGLYRRKRFRQMSSGSPALNLVQANLEPIFLSPERYDRFGSPAVAAAGKGVASALRRLARGAPVAAGLLGSAAKSVEGFARREEKIGAIMKLYEPFTARQNGPFDCSNTRSAHARLPADERERLPFSPESLDYAKWMHEVHLPALETRVFPEMDRRLERKLRPLSPHASLVSMLEDLAERHGHAPALERFEKTGFARVTYLELRARAVAASARLRAAGVRRGEPVLLCAENHPDWAIAYFGILLAGGVAVPLEAGLEADAAERIAAACGARAAILDASAMARLGRIGLFALDLGDVGALPAPELPDDLAPAEPPRPGDVASLIFTSGTTGQPKGVRLTHANFAAMIAALAPLFPLRAKDRVLSVLPLHHTFEFTCGLLLPLSRGARVAYLDERSGERLAEALRQGRVKGMVGVPALWQLLERRIRAQIEAKGPAARLTLAAGTELGRLLGDGVGAEIGKLLFSPIHAALGGSLEHMISGGAALPEETRAFFSTLGLPLAEGYGLTEAAPVLTVAKRAGRGVGKPVPGVELRIDDPTGRGVGEVLARGPNVMAGYTDEGETARVLDGEGWLRTGDLGRLDGRGNLVLEGRLKDVVVTTTGENVYPDDVERLLGEIPHVAELAVVGIESPSGGERVACLAVPAGPGEPGEDEEKGGRQARHERALRELRAAIARLPFGKQPAVVQLQDAPLPRTATRKVKRAEVRAIVERNQRALTRPEGAPQDVTAVRLAIAALRRLPLAEIRASSTLRDELGLDSLASAELLAALEAKGGPLDAEAFGRCATVGELEELTQSARAPAVHRGRAAAASGTASTGKPAEAPLPPLPPAVQDLGKRLLGRAQDAFYGQAMDVRVFGRAFIPHNRNALVVANHASHLDMGLVRHALGRYGEDIVALAAQDYFFDGKLKKAFFDNFTNLAPLDRSRGIRQALRRVGELLDRGKTVLVFPEGTRSAGGEIGEFKALVGQLALAHGVDVLPLHLGGTAEAMPKGAALPKRRELTARIGPPLGAADLARLTAGRTPGDAAREAARLAREAVLALSRGGALDLSAVESLGASGKGLSGGATRAHPLAELFEELGGRFEASAADKPVSFYITLGGDSFSKWFVRVGPEGCEIRRGRPEGAAADCVLKTTPEIFTRIVRDAHVPGPADFLSGAVKSNDVALLHTFQKVFRLG